MSNNDKFLMGFALVTFGPVGFVLAGWAVANRRVVWKR